MKDISQKLQSGKYRLGSLCKRGHEWKSTGKSLRNDSNSCIECLRDTQKRHSAKSREKLLNRIPTEIEALLGVDTRKYYLGKLTCRHNYKESGFSLRRISNRQCKFCESERVKLDRKVNPEKFSARGKSYYYKNKDKVLNRQKQYCSDPSRYEEHKRKQREWQKKYRSKPETIKKINEYREQRRTTINKWYRDYRKTLAGKAVHAKAAHKSRVKKLGGHHSGYAAEEIVKRFEEMGNKCIYCGSEDGLTVDHFISLSSGGSDTIGNIVPCCTWCNSSKSNQDPLSWYKKQSFFSAKNWKALLKKIGKTPQNYMQTTLL